MMHLAIAFAMVLLLGLWSCASAQDSPAGFYRGQVVEVGTKKPLPGVLVAFVWYRDVRSSTPNRVANEFHAATEVLTDAGGRFQVSDAPERNLAPPILGIQVMDPVFFAPAYSLLYAVKAEGEPLRDPTVIYLYRAKNPKDAREPLPLPVSFPFNRTPLLLKALNQERSHLGLSPIQPGKEEKGEKEEYTGDFYRGQVLDVDTGKPLANVLVVFMWERDVSLPGAKYVTSEFHAAIEVLTDAGGRFEVSSVSERTLPPFAVHIKSPGIIFFAPEYLQYSHIGHGKMWRPGGDPALLYMKRVENPRDALEWADRIASMVPHSAIPLLIKALNHERTRLGLPPIQLSKEGQKSSDGFYRGQVVDADTGKPLAGVLVAFIWFRNAYSPATKGIVDEFHAAIEVVTDADGRFEISRLPETTFGPSVVHVQSPGIIFFRPGYILERVEVDPGVKRYRDPTRVYMQRVKNPSEALDLRLHPLFPYNRTPLLLKGLNEERARLGLPPIQPSKEGKGYE